MIYSSMLPDYFGLSEGLKCCYLPIPEAVCTLNVHTTVFVYLRLI